MSSSDDSSAGQAATGAMPIANARRRLLHQLAAGAAGALAVQALTGCEPAPPPAPTALPDGAAPRAGFPVMAGEVGVTAPEHPYGHGLRYGVKTDGSDTTAEIIHWRDSILGLGTYADPYGLRHPRCKAVLPAGVIRITQARALLDLARPGPTIWGYAIEGEGLRLTTIVYDPASPGPLLFSSNRLYGLTVRNLYFASPEGGNAAQSDWLLSESGGQQQYFTFENLAFDGAWQGGVRLSAVPGDARGGDTNSEFKFDRINLGGAGFSDAFLVDSQDDALQSGQFINYWFSNVNTSMTAGRLVHLRRGGHVTITNLDVSGYRPPAETYVIDLPEIAGNDGTHSLCIRNARFESLSEHARFLRCRWERGTVAIDGYDDIVWRSVTRPTFDIRAGNSVSLDQFGKSGQGASAAGAQYWFANGRFTGIHRYVCRGGGEGEIVPATIQYQNCEFCGPVGEPAARSIHAFVRFAADGDKSPVQRPHVRFRACRVEAASNHVTDWDLGIQGPHVSTTAPIKAIKFGDAQHGRLPSGGAAAMMLPPGSLVLRVTWILPGGQAPAQNRAYRFALVTGYAAAARQDQLAVFEGADFNAAASRVDVIAYDSVPWPPPPAFDPIRAATLVLRETLAPGVHPSAQCIVEYI